MSERQRTPPEKLFELLEFCGIRQRDIVVRLGVSKALVSLWRSGERAITLDHYQALLEFAHAIFLDTLKALVRSYTRTPETFEEGLAILDVFLAKLQAANGEWDPTPIHQRLLIAIVALHHTLDAVGEPSTWDDDTRAYVVAEGQFIADAAQALQSRITAAKEAAAFQARTTATLRNLLATLEESPDAETHE